MSHMAQVGQQLLAAGFNIIPIAPREKYPARWDSRNWGLMQWDRYRKKPASAAEVGFWGTWPGAGVGIVCGAVVGIDIDVEDPALVDVIYAIVNKHLGVTPAVRIGREPRKMLVYRTEHPFRKMRRGPVEVLGEGQQFVAYGIHPAGHEYRWPAERLHELTLADLPEVTEERVLTMLDEVWQALPEDMKRTIKTKAPTDTEELRRGGDGSILGQAGSFDAVQDAMFAIPNDDVPWDDWNKIGMALYGALGEDGLSVFEEWSGRSRKAGGKGDSPARRWKSYRKSPPTQLGAGSIYHIARQYGWACPPELTMMPVPEGPQPDISPFLAKHVTRDTQPTLSFTEPAPVTHNVDPGDEEPPLPAIYEPRDGDTSFPLEWLSSPSLIGETARWINDSAEHEHPQFALCNTLAAVAAVIGRRYILEHSNLHPNLFIIAVARAGSGKDHSRRQIKTLFTEAKIDNLLGPENFTGGEAIQRALFKTPSMLSQIDEIGKYMEVVKSSKSDTKREFLSKLLTLYSSSNQIAKGTGYVNATDKDVQRFDVIKPNFNIYGTTNPVSLAAGMTKAMRDDGTIARFIFAPAIVDFPYPRDVAYLPTPQIIVDGFSYLHKETGGGNLSSIEVPDLEPVENPVRMTGAAAEMRAELKHEEHVLKSDDRPAWGRLVENTLKVAMLEAICRQPHDPWIDDSILAMAARLVRWSCQYAERLIETEVASSATEALSNDVRKAVGAGVTTMPGMLAVLGRQATTAQINERLSTLSKGGMILNGPGGYKLPG